jgi:uncharacterized membrane protein YoaK (UPF0700 family)
MSLSTLNKIKLLPALLSIIAGSVDVISFLGLNGLFTSHITGNLVILAVRIVNVGDAPLALILSVPMFILALGLTRLLVHHLEIRGQNSLRTLLWLQFFLLVGFLVLCFNVGASLNANSIMAITGGMLGVAAMAVQNAMVQLSLHNAPATAVMTTNITRFVIDLGDAWLKPQSEIAANASFRAKYTWPAIAGFAIGCSLGALLENFLGLRALILPVCLALLSASYEFKNCS